MSASRENSLSHLAFGASGGTRIEASIESNYMGTLPERRSWTFSTHGNGLALGYSSWRCL